MPFTYIWLAIFWTISHCKLTIQRCGRISDDGSQSTPTLCSHRAYRFATQSLELLTFYSSLNVRDSLKHGSRPKPDDSTVFRLTHLRNALEPSETVEGGSDGSSPHALLILSKGTSREKSIQVGDD